MPTESRWDKPAVPGSPVGLRGPDPTSAVYPPRADTFLLLPFAVVAPESSFLEVGTGAGRIALAAARRGARVVATDLNPHALLHLAAIARSEGLDVHAVRTDLARGLGRFDRIVFNPPYLRTRPDERDSDRWHNLAMDGGPDGCATLARFVHELADHLAEDGSAFVLTSSEQSSDRLEVIWDQWKDRGGTVESVAHRNLEGERLEVVRLRRDARDAATSTARRTPARPRGIRDRPRTRPARRSA